MPMTVFAAAIISLDKTNYDPNEKIIATVTGITAQMEADEAWAGIFKAGASNSDWGKPWCHYVYLEAGMTQIEFPAPSESGLYEMRLFNANDTADTALIMSVPFTVGKTDKQGSITLDAKEYIVGSEITVTVSGITEQMVTTQAYIAVYKKGAENDKWMDYKFVPAGNSTQKLNVPYQNGEFEVRLFGINQNYTDESFIMAVPFTVTGASDWAGPELQKAEELKLIPDCLKGQDLTKPITRAEFAAVSIKVYEALSGEKAVEASDNPFTDTKDPEVLKAFNVGITKGMSATTFEPDRLLDRETAATMLTRVFKKVAFADWTLDTDGKFTLPYEKPAPFADDAKISDWAKDSVYFMAANEIIKGMGNNMFAPKNTTDADIALGYANATREQALIIAARMAEKLKID